MHIKTITDVTRNADNFSLDTGNSRPAEPELQFVESGSSLLPLTQAYCAVHAEKLPTINKYILKRLVVLFKHSKSQMEENYPQANASTFWLCLGVDLLATLANNQI